MSSQVSLSFLDQNNLDVAIKDLKKPITVFIRRESNLTAYVSNLRFMTLNTTADANSTKFNTNQMLTFLTTLNGQSNALIIQLKQTPINSAYTGYFFYFKFGSVPVVSANKIDYDYAKLFCPNGKYT